MLSRKYDVLLPCCLRETNPFSRVEVDGRESRRQCHIFLIGNRTALLHYGPRRFYSGDGVWSPMNEHAKLGVLKPLALRGGGRHMWCKENASEQEDGD